MPCLTAPPTLFNILIYAGGRRTCILSSWPVSRVLYRFATMSVIYLHRMSPCGWYVAFYPLTSDEQPSSVSIHELAASKIHSRMCHHTAGGLLPHLLTLTPCGAVILFCITQPSRTPSIFGSGIALCCPDFPQNHAVNPRKNSCMTQRQTVQLLFVRILITFSR